MKLSCRECGSTFHVAARTVHDLGNQAFCPFCGATMTLTRPPDDLGLTGQPEPRIEADVGLLDLAPEAAEEAGATTTGLGSPTAPRVSLAQQDELRGDLTAPFATPVPTTDLSDEEAATNVLPRKEESGSALTEALQTPPPERRTPPPESDPFAPLGTAERIRSFTYDPLDDADTLDEPWPASTVSGIDLGSAEAGAAKIDQSQDADEPAEPGVPEPEGHDPSLLVLDEPEEADVLDSQDVAVITDTPLGEEAAPGAIVAPDLFVQTGRSPEVEEEPAAELLERAGAAVTEGPQGWLIDKDGPDGTPVGRAEVLRRIRTGDLGPEDLVTPASSEDWDRLEDIPAFSRYVNLYGRRGAAEPEGRKKGFWRRFKGD